jgi:ABC-2 type transport system ATP-binding protein
MSHWAIETFGLGRRYGSHWAVRGLDLQVPRGSAFGLLGPNGAGKSTTIRMLMGLLPASEGSARVVDVDPAADDVLVRGRVGYVGEEHGFYDWMSVDETIGLVSAYHPDWNRTLQRELQEEFALNGRALIRELSKGMRVRLALLLALAFDPELLVLDEPTGGLDPAARRSFIETVLGRFQERGKTILVASHLLNEFSGLLDHVAFLRDGSLDLSMPIDDLRRRVKRVRLVFDGGAPRGLLLPEARRLHTNGREAVAVFDRFDAAETPLRLEATGASRVLVEDLTLEDIFVEMLG